MKKQLTSFIANFISNITLIFLGLAVLVLPQYLEYINKDQLFFDFISLLKDHPNFRYPFGIVILFIGIIILVFDIFSFIYNSRTYVIQKGLSEDYGDIDLGFRFEKIFGINPVVYTNICSTKNKNKELLKIEKKNIKSFYEKNVEKKSMCFLSVSVFPFIVYSGYCVGESGKKILYYHYDRKKKRARLMHIGLFNNNKLVEEINDRIPGNTIRTICISVSYNVDKEIIKNEFSGTSIYFYKSTEIGTDSLKNRNDIEYISCQIRNIISENINKVNLLLSCPAELCFAIGQKLKSPGLPEINVYNYNAKEEKKWNWSISLDEKF